MEDLTGTVRVDLTACERSAGLFTENCVVIAEGEVRQDGVFEVIELMFPPSESREATRNATNALDFFGAGHILRPNELEELERKEQEREGEMFVVLSDVWLDQQRTFDRLEKMFDAYDAQDVIPGLIVFMGDFTSTPFGLTHCDFTAYKEGFDRLADMLEDYPRLRQESRFVFVPGPGDPGLNAALPRPGLQPSLVGALLEKVPRARFASNPAKIRYFSQDLVFFRDDLQAKMRRNCLIPPDDGKLPEDDAADGGASDAVFKHLAATLVQQAHLCPLPITQNPIYWEYDHALWLYPAPNGIFLGDRTGQQALVNFEQTALSNPGCFADDGSFLVYRPATGGLNSPPCRSPRVLASISFRVHTTYSILDTRAIRRAESNRERASTLVSARAKTLLYVPTREIASRFKHFRVREQIVLRVVVFLVRLSLGVGVRARRELDIFRGAAGETRVRGEKRRLTRRRRRLLVV